MSADGFFVARHIVSRVFFQCVQDYFQVFVNGVLKAARLGNDTSQTVTIDVTGVAPGIATLGVLSQTIGLLNYGAFLETYTRGLGLGKGASGNVNLVIWDGIDITHATWWTRPALIGERDRYFDPRVAAGLPWVSTPVPASTPMLWWRLDFPLVEPQANASWALDLGVMGKGAAFVNGCGSFCRIYWRVCACLHVCMYVCVCLCVFA
jgi:hypothetical protein